MKKNEEFAYVTPIEMEEGTKLNLVTRRQIGLDTSIVLVVLRHILEELDSNPIETQSFEQFITDIEIKEEVELFLPEKYNKIKFIKELDNYINKVKELGFLKEVNRKETETRYQIRRIIKEKITLDDLQEFKNKLQEYVKSI